MARPSSFFSLLLLLFLTILASSAYAHGDLPLSWIPAGSACRGTIGECLGVGDGDVVEELGLASADPSRRVLALSGYISYDALRRDSVPCSRRGASYYNCRPGAQANPYSRGCSVITRCRS
ncbi:protein RALF-like 33 [Ananas comosus]|uniref:Protein RALF-like 33 n=2 Tax=Ananas comosus TaxID=4615 RepID=A0A6P5FWB6_ANACO|nr:protein RALF-like 33 [Ananas comosus]CAD1821922.1 unnamed protein product [Ananas comosus var. bracteatus]